MAILLCSLGVSWEVVPEAYLCLLKKLSGYPEQKPDCNAPAQQKISQVHIITTDSEKTDESIDRVRQWFRKNAPEVLLTFARVEGFSELKTAQDHFKFEEVLYRWVLEKKAHRQPIYLCLAGGFKTMSAAMQKAGAVLGAEDIFHVIADDALTRVRNPPEIDFDTLIKNGSIVSVFLGSESGWPQFHQSELHKKYPLEKAAVGADTYRVSVSDYRFRQRLKEVVERSHNISGSWENLAKLPFNALATWYSKDLEWLEEPLQQEDYGWLAALPKIDLHCHLGGFATHGELLEQVIAAAERKDIHRYCKTPPEFPEGWPLPVKNVSIKDYTDLGSATGSNLLWDRGCLKKHCQLLYDYFLKENVIYAEVRCSPANYTKDPDGKFLRSSFEVLSEIRQTFQDCMDKAKAERDKDNSKPYCYVNLILIATRRSEGDYRAAISRHLALAVTAAEHWSGAGTCKVVGVDLAGYEDKETRAHYFREEFTAVHRCGLAVTVHAGENDDAEGIWRAVFDLNARRLGHALRLINSPDLLRSVADRGIGVEMCPYANFQIKHYRLSGLPRTVNNQEYPLLEYLRNGVRVTVNTDNIGISKAGLTDNFMLLSRLNPQITRKQILMLIRNSIETAFLSPEEKFGLLKDVEKGLKAGR